VFFRFKQFPCILLTLLSMLSRSLLDGNSTEHSIRFSRGYECVADKMVPLLLHKRWDQMSRVSGGRVIFTFPSAAAHASAVT